MNYPGMEVDYTRIVEYKHKPNQPAGVKEAPGTVVFKEYSVDEGVRRVLCLAGGKGWGQKNCFL